MFNGLINNDSLSQRIRRSFFNPPQDKSDRDEHLSAQLTPWPLCERTIQSTDYRVLLLSLLRSCDSSYSKRKDPMSLPPFSESEAKVKLCHKLLVDLVGLNIRVPLT